MTCRSLIWQRGLWTCEGSYGRDDLLDVVMSGILLSMCLPGSVTFDFNLPKHLWGSTSNGPGKRIWSRGLCASVRMCLLSACAFKLVYSTHYHMIIVRISVSTSAPYMHLYACVAACVSESDSRWTRRCSAEERPSWFSFHRMQHLLPAVQSPLKATCSPTVSIRVTIYIPLYEKPVL